MLFYFGTAQESVEKAAHEICDLESQKLNDTASATDIDSVLDTKASGDGAWQKRGRYSLNGVVTLIGSEKCFDYEVLSKKCRPCEAWEYKKATDIVGYNDWKAQHMCSINHTGSAGAMEVVGKQKIFLVDLSTSTFYDMLFTLEMATPNHLTRFVNLTPTLTTPLQKENVLVMSKNELVPNFAMSRANIKGKSSPTAKV